METGFNISPQGDGANVNVSAQGEHVHGSTSVHVPSGDVMSGSVGVSGSLGGIDVGHNFASDRTGVSVSNGDGSLRGNVQYDGNTDSASFGMTAKFEF